MNNIKDIVKMIFDDGVDGISFLPSEDERDMDIRGFMYQKKSKYEIHEHLGHRYHIILYKSNDQNPVIDPDNFTAILTDPRVYVSNMILNGFYGIVVKKTKKSTKFINELYGKILTYSL